MIALEERERELLRRVEKVRQVKGKSLHLQIDDLKQGLSSLMQDKIVSNMINHRTFTTYCH
jgi:tripartite motif-containing protein 71